MVLSRTNNILTLRNPPGTAAVVFGACLFILIALIPFGGVGGMTDWILFICALPMAYGLFVLIALEKTAAFDADSKVVTIRAGFRGRQVDRIPFHDIANVACVESAGRTALHYIQIERHAAPAIPLAAKPVKADAEAIAAEINAHIAR